MIKIIIIEDLPIILEGIKVLINQIENFEVVAEYENGKTFIDELNNIRSDIVLTDISMPVMDGIETTKLALSMHPEMNIIALSMYNDYKYYYEMITAGVKGFVLKQSSTKELELAIREVHNGGNYFSKELLHGVVLNMQNIEKQSTKEKKELLNFTQQELSLISYLCQGLTNKELADKLCLSIKTIESHKTKLMHKTKTKNNAGLIIWSIKNKLVDI
jgi:DNA-binding NarL/FixJ family response regulator